MLASKLKSSEDQIAIVKGKYSLLESENERLIDDSKKLRSTIEELIEEGRTLRGALEEMKIKLKESEMSFAK